MTVAHKIVIAVAVFILGFATAKFTNKPVVVQASATKITAPTKIVDPAGNVLTPDEFKELMALQQKANDASMDKLLAAIAQKQANDQAAADAYWAAVTEADRKHWGYLTPDQRLEMARRRTHHTAAI